MNATTATDTAVPHAARPGVADTLFAGERMTRAVARIEASRGALIRCMSPDEPALRSDPSGDGAGGRSFADALAARIERDGLLPGSWRTLRALSRRWWTRQPWHRSVDLVGQTLVHQTRPIIRRHPLASLALAAALGAGVTAALSAARPWAWQRVQHQAGPWKDRLGSLLWSQLAATPVQMALAGVFAAWLADRAKTGAQPPTGSSPAGTGASPVVSATHEDRAKVAMPG